MWRRASLGMLGAASSLAPVYAHALAPVIPAKAGTGCHAAGQSHRWSAPLDRVVYTEGRDLTLRDALDRLAAAARIRLSYTAELLPLDRRVCGTFAGVAAGDALTTLLGATGLEPVVAGADQVVLVAASRDVRDARDAHAGPDAAPAPRPAPEAARPTSLDRVVVTGSHGAQAPDDSPVALDVIGGRQVAERGATSLAATLDAAVPGVWMWTPSPSTFLARYGSIRGASSFGVSAPKIYVDGVEVANPLLVTDLAPESIERVEVIRGPQGAALYGADAISGVVNVVTRHDGTASGGARFELRSDAGVSSSEWAPLGVLSQRHALSLRAGSATRSGGVGVSLGTLGDFVPNGGSREVDAHGDARLVGSRASLTLSARLLDKSAGATRSPLLSGFSTSGVTVMAPSVGGVASRPLTVDSSAALQSMRQYTLGAQVALAPRDGGRWTHTLVAGVDGYRLADAASNLSGAAAIESPSDSALRAAQGGADRLTLRASSTARIDAGADRDVSLTFGVDHSELREQTTAELSAAAVGTSATGASAVRVAWRNSTGLVAQSNVAVHDVAGLGALYVSGGLRFERDAGYALMSDVSALPTLGAAFVRRVGGGTLKLRSAYGRGIRPPRLGYHGALPDGYTSSTARVLVPWDLGPEQQSGVETGADYSSGTATRNLALRVTRFDQRASGLIQAVTLGGMNASATSLLPAPRRVVLENVGEIANRGWELQAAANAGRLGVVGTLSLVDSRIAHTTTSYSGDLRDGDRMLEVPARTMSLAGTWTMPRWSTTWTVSRAADWVGYDRLAMARDAATLGGAMKPRDYWRTYDGVTRLRATFARELPHGLALLFTGDNLLDRQRGEPDDVTVVPGRTVTVGVRARF